MLQQGLDNLDKLDTVKVEEQKTIKASTSIIGTSVSSNPLAIDLAAFN